MKRDTLDPTPERPAASRIDLDDSSLLDLVRLRSGQLHRCAPCVKCYVHELLAHGTSWDKLTAVYQWKNSPCFDPAEKAALALCEAIFAGMDVLQLGDLLQRARYFFSNDEIARLVLCILAVDDLNELCSPI